MEINFRNTFGGGIGVRPEAADGAQTDAAAKAEAGKQPVAGRDFGLRFTSGDVEQSRAEPALEIPAGALRRDDDLGRLVDSAFCLKPPPMPEFDGRS